MPCPLAVYVVSCNIVASVGVNPSHATVKQERECCQAAVTLIENVTVPPWSEVEVFGSTSATCTTGTWLVEGTQPDLPVMVARGVVNPIQANALGCVPIQLCNPSSADITVYSGMEVAVAERIEEHHLIAVLQESNHLFSSPGREVPLHKQELLHQFG